MNGSSHKQLVILGPPGAGKGTQGKLLSETMGLRHIASGDLVRQHQANETDLGLLSRSYYSKGLLVPDEITIKIVLPDVLASSSGFILDGFPRNVSQAKRLDEALELEGLKVERTLLITASRDDTMHRLANRRVCRKCKRVYHTTSAPPLNCGICDGCGEPLFQREDDTPEAIDIRMEEYHAQTLPLAEFYRSQNKLMEVSGSGRVQTVLQRLLRCLESRQPEKSFANPHQAGQPNPGWSFKKRHV